MTAGTKKKPNKVFKHLHADKLVEVIPLFEAGLTAPEIALVHRVSVMTVFRWKKRLIEKGYNVKFTHGNKGGRPKLKIDD